MATARSGTATGSTSSCAAAATRSKPVRRRSSATSSPSASSAFPAPASRPQDRRKLMDFAFSEEQELLRAAAREYLADGWPAGRVVAAADAEPSFDGAAWRELADLGWLDTAPST